jgi:hypothetical protein
MESKVRMYLKIISHAAITAGFAAKEKARYFGSGDLTQT